MASPAPSSRRLPLQLFGGWEAGLLALMALLYLAGLAINPGFFGRADAVFALLRDTAKYGVMAVGMTFVIVNKDIDLSVGSTFAVVAVAFAILFAPTHYDLGLVPAVLFCLALGTLIGLINGVLVTVLRVPAFIATLTMLLIGRGLVLGLTAGKSISYAGKAQEHPAFFALGETNALGFNNQILIFLLVAGVGALVLAKSRTGYETFATGGNDLAAGYSGIATTWVRIRAYLFSALAATLAGLMSAVQDKGITSTYGLSAELIVIAAVFIGGASILGGRGRILGSCLGAALIVLIDKVLREGVPITRIVKVGDQEIAVQAMAQLPAGAVPAFLGVILLLAVLVEPYVIRPRLIGRAWAWLRGKPPPVADLGGVAVEAVQTRGSHTTDRAVAAKGPVARFLARRDAPAIMLAVALWVVGVILRPDYWWTINNSFALLLNFTEVALLTIGLTYVLANGDIDLSVGAVLALAGAIVAYAMKSLGFDPVMAVLLGLAGGLLAGLVNATLTVRFRVPAFVATLGMFYIARGLGAWIVAGQQLTGFPESFNLLGRKMDDILAHFGLGPLAGLWQSIASAVSVQTIFMALIAAAAGIVLAYTPFGQMVYATGGNRRAADYAGIDTDRVRFISLLFSAFCATIAGIIYVAFYRSFNPTAGQFRELDAIAAVIIGGGSIFGGYGTILGALAGAAVISLIRALLQLQVIGAGGQPFVMPQHWVNVFIGLILIGAVLADIWLRQSDLPSRVARRLREQFARRRTPSHA